MGSDEEYKQKLSPEEYHVARQAGTERAFTGRYWDMKKDGIYKCVCCGTPLFDSNSKYDSGSGWPSFFQPISPDAPIEELRHQHGYGPHRGPLQELRLPSRPRVQRRSQGEDRHALLHQLVLAQVPGEGRRQRVQVLKMSLRFFSLYLFVISFPPMTL